MRAVMVCAAWLGAVVFTPVASAQRAPLLDGAWSHVATRIVAPDTTLVGPVLSGFAVVSGRYFSELFLLPDGAGAVQGAAPTTPEQKARRYDVLVAVSGSFEIRDSSITFTHEYDKDGSVMGLRDTRLFRVRGDTLWLISSQPWAADSTRSVRTTLTLVRRR